jgi:hypothetical protein
MTANSRRAAFILTTPTKNYSTMKNIDCGSLSCPNGIDLAARRWGDLCLLGDGEVHNVSSRLPAASNDGKGQVYKILRPRYAICHKEACATD